MKLVRRVSGGVAAERVERAVNVLLRFVAATDLDDLDRVEIRNQVSPLTSRKKGCVGIYIKARGRQRAWIELSVSEICALYPKLMRLSSFIFDFVVADALFHEIGHHVQMLSERKVADFEADADKYAMTLLRKWVRFRVWAPLRRLGFNRR